MSTFSRPTLNEIAERIKNDLANRLGTGVPLKRSFLGALSYAIAAVVHLLYGYVDWVYKQIFPDTCTNENMIKKASFRGVYKKAATFAERDVKFIGLIGKTIPSGTIFSDSVGNQFRLVSDVNFVTTEAIGHVVCSIAGKNGNVSVGSKLIFQSPILDIQSQGEVLSTNFINGVDEESNESLLERYLDKLRRPPNGGSENDYEQWAKEVSGVTRAFIYPGRMGLGTVGVSFLCDNEDPIIPTSGKVLEVQNYLDEKKPVTCEVWVFAPVAQAVDFEIQIKPNTLAIRTEITNEIKDLFEREAAPDKTIPVSKVREAISIASGEYDHILVTPNTNLVPAAGKILVPGTFTFNTLIWVLNIQI